MELKQKSGVGRKVLITFTVIFTILITIAMGFFGVLAYQEYQSKNVPKKLIKEDLIGATFSIDSINVEITKDNLKSMELTDKEVETEWGIRGCIYYGNIEIEEAKYNLKVPIEVYYIFNGRNRSWSLGYQEFNRRIEERVVEIKEQATEDILKASFVGQTISRIEITEAIAKEISIDNIEEDENSDRIVYVEATLYDNDKTPAEKINIESTIKFAGTGWVVSKVYGKREENIVSNEQLGTNKKEETTNQNQTNTTGSTQNNTTVNSNQNTTSVNNTVKDRYLEKYNNLESELNNLSMNYSSSATNTEKKELANTKYDKWDELLNDIWSSLKSTMSTSDFEKLVEVQVEWIVEKENIAKNRGGSLDSLEGLSSLVESTKSRCYTLINSYME